ncbi:MAG: hypothetical protein VX498_00325 [Myxococcota bacterium]|nr:hypothetical protein [Myxococcota bacterium]
MFYGPKPGATTRVLIWTVATPFFCMPLPLTLLAWDLYGGFAIHGKILLALLGLGAVLGIAIEQRLLLSRLLRRLVGLDSRAEPGPSGQESLPAQGASTANVVLLLMLSQILASVGLVAAQAVARLLQLWQPGEGEPSPDTLSLRIVYALLVLTVGLRATTEDDETRFGGAVALGWLLMVACEFGTLVAQWPVSTGVVVLLLGTGLLRWRPLPSRAASLLSRTASVVFVAALVWPLLSRAPQVLFGMDPRPLRVRVGVAIAAAVVTAGVSFLLPKRAWLLRRLRGLASQSATGVLPGPTDAFAGLALALLSLPLSTLGGLCGELSISVLRLGPEGMGLIKMTGPGLPGKLGLALGLLRLGMITRDGEDLRRALRWLGAGFILAAVAGVGSIQSPALRMAADLSLLGLGLLPWVPGLWLRPGLQRVTSALLMVAPVPGLAVAARYLAAAFPFLAEPEVLATVGAALGLPVGFLLTRIRIPKGMGPGRLLFRAVLGLLVLGLLVYLAVFFAVAPFSFWSTLVVLGSLTVVTRLPGWVSRGLPTLPGAVALWLLFYASFSGVVWFKKGPGPEVCSSILASTEARVLLDRFGEGGEYPSGDPYDVLPDPTGRYLVTTFKRFDDRGGWIEVLDIQEPQRRTRTSTTPQNTRSPFWPERFVVNARTGLYYFGMLGIDAYQLWEMELRSAPGETTARMELVRSVPMVWEPSYPSLDLERNLLIQSYLSAGIKQNALRGLEQPLVQTIALDSLKPVQAMSMGPAVEEMSEFVKIHPLSGDYYVPGYFNLVRFALVEVDGTTLQLKRRKETFHPTIAVGFDASGQRMFVTNSLGGTLDEYDVETFERRATVRSGAFPRDLVVDRLGQRVYVGNYSSGTVVEFDIGGDSPVALREVEVGPLLRGIGIHEPSGAVYAASACGVFEVTQGRK